MIFESLIEMVDLEPHSAGMNMAIDEMLLRRAEAPMLRVYSWERPSVSFGYFMKHKEIKSQWPERELVRRWTGGGVVLHGSDLTYTLVVPHGWKLAAMPAAESYQAVHAVLARALDSQLAGTGGAKTSEACFENAVQYDVVRGGQKVAGAAQRRTRFGLLHQGSVQAALPGLAELFGAKVTRRTLDGEAMAEARDICKTRYATAAWMERF